MKENRYNFNNQTGMFRQRIQLRQRTVTQNRLLQDIENYNDFGFYWAMIKNYRNNEIYDASQEQTNYDKRFVIKYARSLENFINGQQTKFEVIHKGVIYDVLEAYNDNELNSTITIYGKGRV